MRFIIIFLFLIKLSASNFAQCDTHSSIIHNGERLSYNVYYKLGFLWFNAAEAIFQTNVQVTNNQKQFVLHGYGQTLPDYDWIYKVRDKYSSVVDSASLKPVSFYRDTKEGKHFVNNFYEFDFSINKIYSSIRHNSNHKLDTLSSDGCVLDVLTAIYVCRGIDFSDYSIGEIVPLKMLIDNEIFDLHIRYLGYDTVTNYNKRVFNCNKFSILLVEGSIFKGGEELYVWITNDKAMIPVRVEAEILVGSVIAEIESIIGSKSAIKAEIQ